MSTPIPPVSPDDGNPADDLHTDVVKDVERDDTITSDAATGHHDDAEDGD